MNHLRTGLAALAGVLAPAGPVRSDGPALTSIVETSHLEPLTAALQRLVDERGPSGANTFFLARYPENERQTTMLWREARQLRFVSILDSDDPERWWEMLAVAPSGYVIDLVDGVVPTVEDIGTSTYLVDAAWANAQVFDAVINGDMIVIHKRAK